MKRVSAASQACMTSLTSRFLSKKVSFAAILGVALLLPLAAQASVDPTAATAANGDASSAMLAQLTLRPLAAADLMPVKLPDLDTDTASANTMPQVVPGRHLSCVPYARERSGLSIFGNAKTWWNTAKSLYSEFVVPKAEAVMVFAGTEKMKLGHVAVVSQVVSNREIRVDQANWDNAGGVNLNVPVIDISASNDWSLVKVWDLRTNQLGARAYPIKGFIAKAVSAALTLGQVSNP
jgi:hypothetical protein